LKDELHVGTVQRLEESPTIIIITTITIIVII
jgi:hypothetical protein